MKSKEMIDRTSTLWLKFSAHDHFVKLLASGQARSTLRPLTYFQTRFTLLSILSASFIPCLTFRKPIPTLSVKFFLLSAVSQSMFVPLLILLLPGLLSPGSYKAAFVPASSSSCAGLKAGRPGPDVCDEVGGNGVPVKLVVPRVSWCWREGEGGTGCKIGWRRWSIVTRLIQGFVKAFKNVLESWRSSVVCLGVGRGCERSRLRHQNIFDLSGIYLLWLPRDACNLIASINYFFITTTPEIDQTGDSKQYISIL